MPARDAIQDLQARMGRSIIGQEAVIERLVIGLLADGHLLVEGLPGLAKTRAVKSLARHLDAPLSRIQFTPDLLPSDVTGSEVYVEAGGGGEFRFQPGPVFSNLVLADEINRAPAKVQAALLEAMEERQVTVAGKTHPLPPLFLVMATQNPIEQEGTYPLPEAQMDRFLMHVTIGYPDEDAEQRIVRLVRGEEAAAPAVEKAAEAPIPQQAVFDARAEVHAVAVAPAIEQYVADLVFATRYPERYGDELRGWIHVGASPRGSLALDRCARARAWLDGRDHVTPDDVRAVLGDCLRHRLILSYAARADGRTTDDVLKEIAARVAVA
ncbi:MAG: MoxR family ATPase [bacterium]|nr:MoxR family ATPase [bacterium]